MSWDYKILKLETSGFLGGKVNAEELESNLNELGRNDWELVAAFDTNMGHGQTRDVITIFKRRR